MVLCMNKLYLMTLKPWLQSNLPQGRLVRNVLLRAPTSNYLFHDLACSNMFHRIRDNCGIYVQ